MVELPFPSFVAMQRKTMQAFTYKPRLVGKVGCGELTDYITNLRKHPLTDM